MKGRAIVAKFGGSSLADAQQVQKVIEILSNPDTAAHYLVVSAPGKRYKDDVKVTDLFITLYNAINRGVDSHELQAQIFSRYDQILDAFGHHNSSMLQEQIDKIVGVVARGASLDYVKSRGEYLMALCMAKILGRSFIDAGEIIEFDSVTNRSCNWERTDYKVHLRFALEGGNKKGFVIPGYYGVYLGLPTVQVVTFDRGGSDITGAIIAKAIGATEYHNWTDVNGILSADPQIVHQPTTVSQMSYQEARELTYGGAGVLHHDALLPVAESEIVTRVRDTSNPHLMGTKILPVKAIREKGSLITGVSAKTGFTKFSVHKIGFNSQTGAVARVLIAVAEKGVSVEHLSSGVDSFSFTAMIGGYEADTLAQTVSDVSGITCQVEPSVSAVVVVGRNMKGPTGALTRVTSALTKAGISILIPGQDDSEISIVINVKTEFAELAQKVIYNEFFNVQQGRFSAHEAV